MSDTDRPTTPGRVVKPPPFASGWRSIIAAGMGCVAVVCLTLAGYGQGEALWAVVALVALSILGKDITPALEALTALAGAWRSRA